MKKTLLSAAAFAVVAVSAVAVAPTTSEAIPAFARQTGAACLSCHFQTFPAINGFGRAFKKGSFTDVGEQALVEDDNLSIPSVLNATVVIRGDFTNTKVTGLPIGTTNPNISSGAWNIPSETPILIAGRLGSNTGAFVEFANGGAGNAASTVSGAAGQALGSVVSVGNWQLLNSFDVGDFKVGIGAHNSSFGGSAVMETSNVFGQHSGKLGGNNLSAINNMGFAQNTLAVGAWAGNDMGDLQIALIAPNAAQGTNVNFKLATLVRAHGYFDISGFDTMVGFGLVTGKAGRNATAIPAGAGPIPMNLWFVDAQTQGEIGDTSVGIYADYANAKGKTNNNGAAVNINNFYGLGAMATNFGAPAATALHAAGSKNTAWSLRAEIKPLHNVGLGAGYFSGKNTTAALDTKVTMWQVAAFYEIYQNFEINLIYNEAKATGTAVTALGANGPKMKTTTVEFEALM